MKTDISLIFDSFKRGVAHRGLHDDVRPENSKAAFLNAVEHNLPFETDIHLTLDHQLVVNHDHELLRVTGKDGIIEKLALKEIKENYRLKDGSELLTVGELFELWGEKVPLVLEIKEYFGNGSEIRDTLKPYLDKIKDTSKLVLISFKEAVVRVYQDDRFNRGLLVGGGEIDNLGDFSEWEFIDIDFALLNNPRFVEYRKNGGKILSWTIHDEASRDIAKKASDAMTFEIIAPEEVIK